MYERSMPVWRGPAPDEFYTFLLPDGATVRVSFYGRQPTAHDIQILREYLAVTEKALGIPPEAATGERRDAGE